MRGLLACLLLLLVQAAAPAERAVAFFYGAHPPARLLAHFDDLVLEPDHLEADRLKDLGRHSRLLAYVSVGEVDEGRSWSGALSPSWTLGRNPAWNSRIMDLSDPGWRRYLLEERFRPLWRAGYRGFFLDTLDSHRLVAKTPEARRRQEAGLVELVRRLRREFPQARILVNRGFEVLDRIAPLVDGLAAESLFAGWDPARKAYRPVPEPDRRWLQARLEQVRQHHPHLQLLVLDYLPPARRQEAAELARRIHALGFTPWISTVEQDEVGVGLVEVLPRDVLMLWDSRQEADGELAYADIHRMAAMPLEYLGYVPRYHDLARGLPPLPSPGRHAGVVTWFHAPVETPGYANWLEQALERGVPVLMLGDPGFDWPPALLRRLGLERMERPAVGPWSPVEADALVGFESRPPVNTDTPVEGFLPPGDDSANRTRLSVRGEDGRERAVVLTAPWGGIALAPWIVDQSLDDHIRWILDPFELLRQALQLPDLPLPDVTTLNGRRLWMNHIDGDAFISRAELPGTPWAAEVIRDRVLARRRVPHTVSVIEGEIGPDGLQAGNSAELEAIARSIFRLPNVEAASHSYSHPFVWSRLQEGDAPAGYNLPVPGYRFDLEREIAGSVRYIEQRLLPAGKRCRIFQWTGDTLPGAEALAVAEAHGLLNINGGDTYITRLRPFLAFVSPMARTVDGHLQVYAPVMNENVYTNNWTGPYFGFRRVIETFELTDRPRRLKPIDIYYHFYSGTKPAALRALDQVYDWAEQQETTPVFAGEYIPLVEEFRRITLARRMDGRLQYRGIGRLRQLRLLRGDIDRKASLEVAGTRRLHDGLYIHLAGPEPVVAPADSGPPPAAGPGLHQANGHLRRWHPGTDGIEVVLEAHVPALLEVDGVKSECRLTLKNGRVLHGKARDGRVRFRPAGLRKIDGTLRCR